MPANFETERLYLRALIEEDAPSIFKYRSSKDNFPFVEMPLYRSVDEAYSYIRKMNEGMQLDAWYCYAIVLKETDEIIGTISIWNFDDERTQAEIGYGLFEDFKRKGYMSEALNWAVEYGFSELGLTKLEAYTSVENEASILLLERNGFKKEKVVMDDMAGTGTPVAMGVYFIDKYLGSAMKIVAITGAGSGLGRELSFVYAKNNYHVVLLGRTVEKLNEVTKIIESSGGEATPIVCDITDVKSVIQAVTGIEVRFKSIDVLINNAGYGAFGELESLEDKDIDLMIDTNIRGTINATKYFMPHIRERIINIISTAGLKGKVNESVYCASKYAVRGFTESLQLELKDRLDVTAVYMGGMATPFWDNSDHIKDKLRLKSAKDVAQAIYDLDDGRAVIEV
ncbi:MULTISPECIES: SDR family NAD(P)-dependent oxidoreductase [unclassified Fusibacter]|uniref:SDR family NAD(P)-dependent oxidoreductase n=1 Tax=unclassified Fusibacter TaxID=2624464 RepID=UPI0010122792|nr:MULTISPECIES: SDR family NAD(P)-dependent oxidoreductase [unclassified Fusibacter]MCK8060928.1 SDR family NAD(P)-dependent oxidoreductase [Fusibacter sp. A2]NPE23224.1 SDR family NAD(P)-dependent oxidoreductase [Fusibacter sp. A1]RXV59579.1 SDR family NAD(P)-dependent oxidoreductase [Fusibacter sp. A1]